MDLVPSSTKATIRDEQPIKNKPSRQGSEVQTVTADWCNRGISSREPICASRAALVCNCMPESELADGFFSLVVHVQGMYLY